MTPSLLIVPDRYKAAKLYSQLPESGAGDFTVTRGTTATRVNASGLIESVASGVPRLDYTGGGCPSLLVEPAATNLVLRSEEFNNAYWSKVRTTISANATATIDPSGQNNADLMAQDAADTNAGAFFKNLTFAAVAHTFSVFAKMDEVRYINLAESASIGSTRRTWFDLQNGVVGTANAAHTAKIDNYGNGWYRCSIAFTAIAGTFNVLTYLADADNSTTAVVSKGSYFWGAQLETGSRATSYIPTVAATQTRNADVISLSSVSGLIGQTEGTIYAEINVSRLLGTQSRYILNISDGTANNRIYLAFSGASSNILRARVWSSNVLQATIDTSTISTLGTYKLAIAYANNDIVFYVNGVQIGTDTSATIPACSNVNLGSSQGNLAQFNDRISAAAIYTSRLSNSELQSLTTL